MVKPTDRRISLQPVFEPFDFVDSESMMQPLPTNGYHPESSDDEANLFAGLHCEPTEAAGSGSEPSGSEPSGSPANGTASINGAAINGAPINGGATGVPAMTTVFAAMNGGTNGIANGNGTVNGAVHGAANNGAANNGAANNGAANNGAANNGAANNGAANGAVNHAKNRIADELNADPDLALTTAAFSAESTSTANHDLTPPTSDDLAIGQNGDSHLITDELLLGEAEVSGEAPHAADAERFEAASLDAAPFDVSPPADDQAIQPAAVILPPAEPFPQEPLGDASDIATTAREPHPAAGSMFMPYLVTEIRELRNRSPRRRSWWRRLFG